MKIQMEIYSMQCSSISISDKVFLDIIQLIELFINLLVYDFVCKCGNFVKQTAQCNSIALFLSMKMVPTTGENYIPISLY